MNLNTYINILRIFPVDEKALVTHKFGMATLQNLSVPIGKIKNSTTKFEICQGEI